ncbi:MAG: PilZ domain-containing protein [Proteobacteria bacterium]|nr:PilZ domain-containing protein [Pseudomonadota bacterium]
MFGLFGDKKKASDNAREHTRFETAGEKVRIYEQVFDLGDLSEGGMRVIGYDDDMKANHYFELHLLLPIGGEEKEFRGHTKVVRQWDDQLACQFTKP